MFRDLSIFELGSYDWSLGYFAMHLGNLINHLGDLEIELGNSIHHLGNLEMELGNLDDLMVEICNLVGWGKDYVDLKGRFWKVNPF